MTIAARNMAPAEGEATRARIRPMLTRRQKAAVIVRLLLSEDEAALPLSEMSDEAQSLLAGQMAQMRALDAETVRDVVDEFCNDLERVGLTFPKGLEGALELLDGHLSASAAGRLRRMVASTSQADPWPHLVGLSVEQLLPVAERESPEIGAILLSKMSVPRAAEILGRLSADQARRIAYAVSQTSAVAPETVRKIGAVLLEQLDAGQQAAFGAGPVERVGAILNQSATAVRETVIAGLSEEDAEFASAVKKAIFTYALIPERIEARDIPKIVRQIDRTALLTALAGSVGTAEAKSAAFILGGLSQRMAESLRDEIGQLPPVKPAEAETAQSAIVATIRDMESAGELSFAAAPEEAA